RLAALDAWTGGPTGGGATSFDANGDGTVRALAISGSTLYAGGAFTNIGGQARNRIAALDATTGNASSWNPNSSGAVYSLAVSGSTIYAAGLFSTIGGQSRLCLAAFDSGTSAASSWNPTPNGVVNSIAVTGAPGNSTIYAGGAFFTV